MQDNYAAVGHRFLVHPLLSEGPFSFLLGRRAWLLLWLLRTYTARASHTRLYSPFSPFHSFFSDLENEKKTRNKREKKKGVHQTARTIEELSGTSFLNETHPGSRCYRVHDPVLAFAKTVLLRRDVAPPGGRRRGVAEEGKPTAEEDDDGAHDEAAAMATRNAAVASQARYLGRVNTLLRFSGGGSGTSVGETEAARRCGEMVLLGGLPALAALWQSMEDVRSAGGCGGRGRESETASMAATGPLLEHAYGVALEGMGECVEAASGYWAAAKLMQLQVRAEKGHVCLSHQQRSHQQR